MVENLIICRCIFLFDSIRSSYLLIIKILRQRYFKGHPMNDNGATQDRLSSLEHLVRIGYISLETNSFMSRQCNQGGGSRLLY